MLRRVGHQLLARQQVPSPTSNDLTLGIRHRRRVRAHLVVALRRGAVGIELAPFSGDLDRRWRSADARSNASRYFAFIDGVAAEHREDEVADKLLAQIVMKMFLGLMPSSGLLARAGSQFLALPRSAVKVTTSQF